MRAGLNLKDKKCNNCGKIFPENTNICDNCGSVSFTFLDFKKESEIETKSSSQELIEQEKRIQQVKEADHLCDNCEFEFVTCKSKKIVFGIDIDECVSKKDADKVIECKKYKEKNQEEIKSEFEEEKEFFEENSEEK